MNELQAQLLRAHEDGNAAALVDIYTTAAEQEKDDQRRAFLLTQAHVFALEIDHPDAPALRAALIALNCETPL